MISSYKKHNAFRLPQCSPHRIQEVVDAAAERDIKTAFLTLVCGKGNRKNDPLYTFSRTVSTVGNWGVEGTAKGGGVDLCMARSKRKRIFLVSTSFKGSFYRLCSLAIAPRPKG